MTAFREATWKRNVADFTGTPFAGVTEEHR